MLNENLVTDMLKSISEAYAINNTKLFPLASIYFPYYKTKLVIGDKVLIENGELMNIYNEAPTHEIIKLEGTLNDNKHRITVKTLSTNEVNTIDL